MGLLIAVNGAKTSCNGAVTQAARGEVLGTCDVEAAGCDDSILTESDKVVGVNIMPLPSNCKYLGGGCLGGGGKQPCLPIITTDWNNTASGVGDIDERILTENSNIICQNGGRIDIVDPNQTTITTNVPDDIFDDGILTMEEAEELFAYLAAQEDIAFAYPIDGCYARAHIMTQKMIELGMPADELGKAWTFAQPGEALRVDTNHDPNGYVQWGWHVAPTINVVDENGNIVPMVIDPSIETGPVSVDDWVETSANGGNPDVKVTDSSPYAPNMNGDLIEIPNPDASAEETMDLYLILEEESENSYEGGD